MDLKYTYTRLNVENFQACKAFYRDILGLAIKFEDDQDEYVEFDTGSVAITLFNRQKLSDFVEEDQPLNYDTYSARVVISFKVGDIEKAVSDLKDHHVEILNTPTIYPDRGFVSTCFRDPDGNLIEFEEMIDVLIS